MSASRVFDEAHYEALNRARGEIISGLLTQLKMPLALESAIDAGCGLGFHSEFLRSIGFRVTGIDGREENIAEGKRRYPQIAFMLGDMEQLSTGQVSAHDLVLCLGLLYHLENPLRVVRNLHDLAKKVLIVESMCAPGADASMQLLDEFHGEDQGLQYVAFYPTEACLVKMLYRAGFPFVYGLTELPTHADFRATRRRKRARTMLVASKSMLNAVGLRLLEEPVRPWDIWSVPSTPWRLTLSRVANSVRKRVSHASLFGHAPRKS